MNKEIQRMPFVSIIVPVFNVEKYLAKCLDSLLGQTLYDIEIICVNDCSTDRSLLILREYEKKDSRIVVVDLPENRKQGGARNAGIRIARAPYLGFVDSDDWVKSEMYEKLYTLAMKKEADMVCCDYYVYNSENDIQQESFCDLKIFTFSIEERNKQFLLNGMRLWTNLFKRSLFFDNKLFFPEKLLYEDNAVVAALYLSASQVVKEEGAYYYYRQDNISTTRGINNYSFFNRLETSKMFLEHMKRLDFYSRYRNEIDFRFIELFYVNTIMGALSQFVPPAIEYVDQVKEEIKAIIPSFNRNIYYKKRISLKIRVILAVIQINSQCGIYLYLFLRKMKELIK